MIAISASKIICDFADPASDIVNGTVLVDGDQIISLEDPNWQGETEQSITLPGRTVAPGLMDSHVHLAFDGTADPVGNMHQRDREQTAIQAERAARDLLLGGVTFVRDLGAPDRVALNLRDQISLKAITGPTIFSAGRPLTRPQGHCWFMGSEVHDAASAQSAVNTEVERGADLIKVMVTGGRMTPGTDPLGVELNEIALRFAVKEAHDLGRPVAAHALSAAGVLAAAAAGADTIEHGTLICSDPYAVQHTDADRRLRKRAIAAVIDYGTTISPTFSVPDAGTHPVTPQIRADWISTFHEAGVPVIAGTDSGINGHPHRGAAISGIRGLVAAGMTNSDALAAASGKGMVAAGRSTAGYLRPGFKAELIVLNDDPRRNLETVSAPEGVMVGGVYYQIVRHDNDNHYDQLVRITQ